MIKNNKGAALMQVLLITMILAGMATMLLRASLSRTASARKTRRTVTAEMLIESCMAEVNALWSAKSEGVFLEDLATDMHHSTPIMYTGTDAFQNTYVCSVADPNGGEPYQVTARFVEEDGNWLIKYEVEGIE